MKYLTQGRGILFDTAHCEIDPLVKPVSSISTLRPPTSDIKLFTSMNRSIESTTKNCQANYTRIGVDSILMETDTSERIQEIKRELGIKSDVEIGKLAGAAKSVVGQWLNGKIKSIHPRYAFNLEKNTGYQAKWIMFGEGPKTHNVDDSVPLTGKHFSMLKDEMAEINQSMKFLYEKIENGTPKRRSTDTNDKGVKRRKSA